MSGARASNFSKRRKFGAVEQHDVDRLGRLADVEDRARASRCWSPGYAGQCARSVKGLKPAQEPSDYDRRPAEAEPGTSPVQNPGRKRLELAAAPEPVGQTVAGTR
jgi:hypothetical protein